MLSKRILQRMVQPTMFRRLQPNSQFFFSAKESIAINPEVEEKIMYILKMSPKCDQTKLAPTAKLTELGFDSLDVVELIVAFEENLGYDLPDEAVEKNMETVKDVLVEFSKHFPAEKRDLE